MESQETQPRQEQSPPPPPLPPLRSKPSNWVLVSRGYTIIVLLASLILVLTLKNTDKETGGLPPPPPEGKVASHSPPPAPQPTFKISELGSLRSVLIASVFGMGCNLFQLCMLICCMVGGKDLTSNKYNIFFNYYIDKAVALLLAASAGAGLGSVLDIKQVRPSFKYVSSFFSLGEISTILLASATISTSLSSACSAKAMQDYKRTVERGENAVGILGRWATKAYNYCFGH